MAATAGLPAVPAFRKPAAGEGISSRRRNTNRVWWVLCTLGLALVVIPVVWILAGVMVKGVSGWHWSVLTQTTTGIGGGLSNAIVGTFVIMACVGVVAGTIGILCGVYLAEIRRPGRLTTLLRSGSEVLAGMPSIVFGYVGYIELVVAFHWGYSLLPAIIALSALVVPYIAKATELALSQVPLNYREGGEALGMTRTLVLRRVVFRSAIPGIATGLIFALAISVGETAPLLYTANFSNAYPKFALLHQPVGYLTYAVFAFFDDPSAAVQQLSHDASMLLIILVLLLIIASRLVVRATQKYSPNRSMSSGGGGGNSRLRERVGHVERSVTHRHGGTETE